MSDVATFFDTRGAARHCTTQSHIFSMMDLTIEDLDNGLSGFEKGISTAVSKACKGLDEGTSTSVIAFARMLDIARMKGLYEVAIYKKYRGYAAANLAAAKQAFGFVRAGVEALDNQMFFS
jgi:hypothetical protein